MRGGGARLVLVLLLCAAWPLAAAENADGPGWTLSAAGFGDDRVEDMARSGNDVVIVGSFSGWMRLSDGIEAVDANASSINLDGFVAWATSNGTWRSSTLITSANGTDVVDRIVALPDGDIVVAGRYCAGTAGEACNATYGPDGVLEKEQSSDDGAAFLARIRSDGTWLWARALASDDAILVLDLVRSGTELHVAVLHQGQVRMEGLEQPDIEADRAGATVLRFDSSGIALGRVDVRAGTSALEEVGALCLDRSGVVHFVVSFAGSLVSESMQINSSGGTDVAVLRLENDKVVWMASSDSMDDVAGIACTSAAQDGVVVAGTMRGSVAFGDLLHANASSIDAWTARVTAGGAWQDLERFGGSGTDRPAAVLVNAEGSRLLVGSSTAEMRLDEQVLPDADGSDMPGANDGWLVHLGTTDASRWARSVGGEGDERIAALLIDNEGRWVVTGTFDDDLQVDNATLQHEGGTDIFLWAYAADLDDDGVLDGIDTCPRVANPDQADLDGDGRGDVCDDDDDGDGLADALDDCPTGTTGWRSTRDADHDGDGCRDLDEDFDDDEDGVFDHLDLCPKGPLGWVSTPEGDEDGDGCSDVDTDGDGWVDQADVCPNVADPSQHDLDDDGIGNACDDDVDGDGVLEAQDECPLDFFRWTSTPITDHDADGCIDTEDLDDDNDGVLDAYDRCPTGDVGWPEADDHDGDGCRDEEDLDDDDDGRLDPADGCPTGTVGRLGLALDADSDGCADLEEDLDDDGDGVLDDVDRCDRTEAGAVVDGQGCSAVQADDDGDGVPNLLDLCGGTDAGLRVDLEGCALPGQTATSSGMAPLQWVGLSLMLVAAVGFIAAIVIASGRSPPTKRAVPLEEE